jgi:hypothetical protein
MNLSSEETVRAVGEVQSPPGTSTTAKNRAFAQAGIYTLGHFSNTTHVSKLATVVLYKDLTAHVALASIRRAEGGTDIICFVQTGAQCQPLQFAVQGGYSTICISLRCNCEDNSVSIEALK